MLSRGSLDRWLRLNEFTAFAVPVDLARHRTLFKVIRRRYADADTIAARPKRPGVRADYPGGFSEWA